MTDIDSPDTSPETSAPDAPAQPADNGLQSMLYSSIQQITGLVESINQSVERLQTDFETKIRYDNSKEKTIDALHRELQDYRDDLVLKHLRPLANDLITLYDNVGRILTTPNTEQTESTNRLLNNLEGFQQDIQEMLARNGIEIFEADGDVFTSPQQRSQQTLPTDQPDLDKHIAARLRKGFRYGERVLRPEIVNIYRYTPPATS